MTEKFLTGMLNLNIKNIFLYFSVDIMKDKLDSENLGIITRSSFLEEFYPGETTPETPKTFTFYHYNGLARSCPNNKVKFVNKLSLTYHVLMARITVNQLSFASDLFL